MHGACAQTWMRGCSRCAVNQKAGLSDNIAAPAPDISPRGHTPADMLALLATAAAYAPASNLVKVSRPVISIASDLRARPFYSPLSLSLSLQVQAYAASM